MTVTTERTDVPDYAAKVDVEPRRLTVSERLHEVTLAALQRRTPAAAHISISQVKAVGGATVIEWDVQVPVCDEYPTAEAAFQAAVKFSARLREKYPPASGNGTA